MERHVKNYLEAFGFSGMEFIPCEVCGNSAVDIHHIRPRSFFGSKRKDEQDKVSNLVALCRICHDKAHGPASRWWKEKLTEIANSRAFSTNLKTLRDSGVAELDAGKLES